MSTVKPIPEGAHAVIASLTIKDCDKAIDFYKRALGAEEIVRHGAPDGKSIWHAELRVRDTVLFVNDEMPGMGSPAPSKEHPAPVSFWVWVTDADAAHKRATDAGATALWPVTDMFWGDRTGTVLDPFGYKWTFATHVKDMTPDEMHRAGEEFAKKMAQKG
jgi:uncharacterized glyoxalase superfamily protein PhnB